MSLSSTIRAIIGSKLKGPSPTVDQLYTALGMMDPYQYAEQQATSSSQTVDKPLRRIGATTWMAVHLVIDVLKGDNIILTAGNRQKAREIVDSYVIPFLDNVGAVYVQQAPGKIRVQYGEEKRTIQVADRGVVGSVSSYRDKQQGIRTITFDDDDWHERLVDTLKSPFDLIHLIAYENGKFLARDRSGSTLMELTQDGACEYLRDNPETLAANMEPFKRYPTFNVGQYLYLTPEGGITPKDTGHRHIGVVVTMSSDGKSVWSQETHFLLGAIAPLVQHQLKREW